MMRPHLRFFMPGSATRQLWNAAERLVAITASHFSIGKSSTFATNWMPALLTSTSTAPNVFSAVAIIVGDFGGLGHVGARVDRLHAELFLDAGALLLDRRLVAEAVDGEVAAFAGEGARDRKPDAGGGAGDDDGFSLERHDVTFRIGPLYRILWQHCCAAT